MSLTPDPVSLRSLSLSGSEPSLASDLFFRIDLERLCVSPEPSVVFYKNHYKLVKSVSKSNIYLLSLTTEAQRDVD